MTNQPTLIYIIWYALQQKRFCCVLTSLVFTSLSAATWLPRFYYYQTIPKHYENTKTATIKALWWICNEIGHIFESVLIMKQKAQNNAKKMFKKMKWKDKFNVNNNQAARMTIRRTLFEDTAFGIHKFELKSLTRLLHGISNIFSNWIVGVSGLRYSAWFDAS